MIFNVFTKMSSGPIWLIVVVCAILYGPHAEAEQPKKKSVLVLHSYHKGLSWTDTITAGIEQRFRDEGMDVELSYEFMDTKRFFSAEHYQNVENLYRHKYNNTKFDVIISSDDNAFQFLLRNGDSLFNGVPVVFCGVNNYIPEQIEARTNFTGVQEDFDFLSTIKVALQLQDGVNKVFVIGDRTTSGIANKEKFMTLVPQFGDEVSFEFIENYPMAEVLRRVAELKNDTIAMWLHFTVDGSGQFYSFEDSSELISKASSVPLYSSWDFHMDHGIAGGMITSGTQQGYTAAGLAARILAGEKATEIPVVSKSPNQFMFDHVQLERFGIDPSKVPTGSIVINTAESKLALDKKSILTIIVSFTLLSGVILLLSVSNIKRLRAERLATSAKNRYRGIFNNTNVAILIEDYSPLVNDFRKIRLESQGDFKKYLLDNSDTLESLGKKIRVKDANPAALELYSVKSKDDLDGIMLRSVTSGSGNNLLDFLVALLERRENYTVETINKTLTGKYIYVIVDVRMPDDFEDYGSVLVSVVDITERKKVEIAFKESESRFRTAFNGAATGMALLSLDGQYQKVNEVICSKLGYQEEELIGMNWRDVTHPDDLDESLRQISSLKYEEKLEPHEKRYLSKSGETIWALYSAARINDSKGKPINYISQFQDITPRKKAEQKLLEQKERYRKYFEEDLSGVFVIDRDGKFITCNQAFKNILGIDESVELNKINYFQFFRNDFDGQNFFNTLVVKRKLEYYELNLKKNNDTPIEVVVNAIGRFSKTNKLREIQGYVMDVTQQRALEKQLLQAQKLESIGTMAGGVAHDFNNLLMGVLGNTSLLMLDKDQNHPDFNRLKNIEEYVKSGSSLTKQLLGFAKGGKYEVKPYDINEIVKYNSAMFNQTRKEVTIELQLQAFESAADVDRSQIDQVMYNLYVNAWQAMIDGGQIIIRTLNEELEEEVALSHNISTGKYIKIEVEDDGEGMEQETLQRIFDPFFTTKEISRGIGLGLASTYGIIKNHLGAIVAKSKPGIGTCFTIYLPVSKSVPDSAINVKEETNILMGEGKILFVDDEDLILGVGNQMLVALGYQVEQAMSGEEAIKIYSSMQNEIDLVILDMVMPGMGGGETFDALKKIDDRVKVLLSSGYSLNKKSNEILRRGCLGFLQKPFDLETLSEKVRQVLDSSKHE